MERLANDLTKCDRASRPIERQAFSRPGPIAVALADGEQREGRAMILLAVASGLMPRADVLLAGRAPVGNADTPPGDCPCSKRCATLPARPKAGFLYARPGRIGNQ
jgi:hypothetical protein